MAENSFFSRKLLISGYGHEMERILTMVIPHEIMALILKFHGKSCYLFVWMANNKNILRQNEIHFINLSCNNSTDPKQNVFKLNVINENKNEKEPILKQKTFDRYYDSKCTLKNVSLPPSIIDKFSDKLSSKHKYSLLIRIGGTFGHDQTKSALCDATIINPLSLDEPKPNHDYNKTYDSYFYNLPNLPNSYGISSCSVLGIKDTIYCIGGFTNVNVTDKILYLNLSDDDKMEWREHKTLKLKHGIFGAAVCSYKDRLMIIAGGRDSRYSDMDDLYVMNLNGNDSIYANVDGDHIRMNRKRYKGAACALDGDRVIIGAGTGGNDISTEGKTFEIYDMNKNIVTNCEQQTRYKHSTPQLWVNESNRDIVYCCGSHNDDGYKHGIEFVDLRENTKLWSVAEFETNSLNGHYLNSKKWKIRGYLYL